MSEQPIQMTETQLRRVMKETVQETLTRIGVDASDPHEMQKDFVHLRDMRVAYNSIRKKGLTTIVGIAFAGICAAVWLGFQQMLGK